MHIFHNIDFDVEVTHSEGVHVSWEKYYVDFVQDILFPKIEAICDAWDAKHPNTKCSIETLELNVDIDTLNKADLQRKLTDAFSNQLKNIDTSSKTQKGAVKAIFTKQAAPFDGFTEYLKKGILPAYISIKEFKEWLGKIENFSSQELIVLKNILSKESKAIERMLSIVGNDYVKFSQSMLLPQITEQYVKLDEEFFKKFFKEICKKLSLNHRKIQAEIWYKTLGWSSSLKQFSKTLIQLLESKAHAEHKKIRNTKTHQISVLVLQAIIQNELSKPLQLNVSEAITISDIETPQGENFEANSAKIPTEAKKKNNRHIDEKIPDSHEKESKVNKKASDLNESISKSDKTKPLEAETEINGLNEVLSQVTEDTTFGEKIEKQPTVQKQIELTTEKAGLILLHPFLKIFFKEAKLLSETEALLDETKACMLLHYLATEMETAMDAEFTLEKIMLGIPLDTVINNTIPLTEEEKNMCNELLKAVLGHWSVLKNSTVNTLRDMFLKRDGIIEAKEDSLLLHVERNTQDILLDKVPWNISLFRLTWMEQIMHVQW